MMPQVDFPQSIVRAGIARRDITLPVGIYHRMWGAATHDVSTGVHRPLLATALVHEPDVSRQIETTGTSPQALVAVDHCLLWNEDMESLHSAVCQATGLRADQLHIAFSHTHAAGLMDRRRGELPGGKLIGPYLDEMAERIAEAVVDARASMQPAAIVYGTGQCDLARHRDAWDAQSGQFVCGFNPEGPADDTVVVARITTQQDETLATLVNYACHATTLAWQSSLISPDFVGAMREVVERDTDAPCLFLQGASGDLGPRHGYVGDPEIADKNGRQLGFAALSALESLPPPGQRFAYAGPVVSGATLGTWQYERLSEEALCGKGRWRCEQFDVELFYRDDLPTREQTEQELAHWTAEEESARQQGDQARARDARANAERMARQLARIGGLPPGDGLPVQVAVWQLGDAVWIATQGEHYHLLQRSLRERFSNRIVLVATVTNGWRPGYVPTEPTYGRGIYQESIAVVAPGSLERLIQAIGDRIDALLAQ